MIATTRDSKDKIDKLRESLMDGYEMVVFTPTVLVLANGDDVSGRGIRAFLVSMYRNGMIIDAQVLFA